MQGEFNGDFTRDTHNPHKRFSRVLMQQGRVLLDADWNEQTSIVLHYLRSLAADLIGPYGGPKDDFKISANDKDFTISAGHHYVNGILCENGTRLNEKGEAADFTYFNQPNYPFDAGTEKVLPPGRYLAYLDVWERHVTFLADEDPRRNEPSIREVALGGPDTASRAQVVWQVRLAEMTDKTETNVSVEHLNDSNEGYGNFGALLRKASVIPSVTGQLRAGARKPETDGGDCACSTSPESRYRGVENQLYRVEIHKSGVAWDGGAPGNPSLVRKPDFEGLATFKWSRENGSVVFRIRKPVASGNGETTVALTDLGRDVRFGLKKGDWVEIVDDDYILQNRAKPLLQVHEIKRDERTVTLRGVPGSSIGQDLKKHPLLRRWDHRSGDPRKGGLTIHDDGAARLQEGTDNDAWLHLEDGVQIQFQGFADPAATYKTGDYWLIPARVATGDVEWPGPTSTPAWLSPHGIEHHYAPLWIVTVGADGKVTVAADNDCRRKFKQLWE